MRFDLPKCWRCFFCVPLRYGIILFGYLNSAFALQLIAVEIQWLTRSQKSIYDTLTSDTHTIFRGAAMYCHEWLPLTMYSMEIVFNIILLIGAHAKKPILLKIYYYYSITTTVAALLILLLVREQYSFLETIKGCLAFIALVTQIYLTLLIHNELSKSRYQEGTMSFANQISEITFHPAAWNDNV